MYYLVLAGHWPGIAETAYIGYNTNPLDAICGIQVTEHIDCLTYVHISCLLLLNNNIVSKSEKR